MDRRMVVAGAAGWCAAALAGGAPAAAATARELQNEAAETLARLRASSEAARAVLDKAKGVLVFPRITKGGLLLGAAAGEGVLEVGGRVRGYYLSTALSYGLQAGVSTFGYVMVFLDEASLNYLDRSGGWEVGVGPNVTVADDGFARRFSTTTALEGVVVFFVDQTGYFAGLGVEGSKITRIEK